VSLSKKVIGGSTGRTMGGIGLGRGMGRGRGKGAMSAETSGPTTPIVTNSVKNKPTLYMTRSPWLGTIFFLFFSRTFFLNFRLLNYISCGLSFFPPPFFK
jgi:hypothetical protein